MKNATALAERIEAIAAELILDQDVTECRDRWVGSLCGLAELARSCGNEPVAEVADGLVKTVSTDPQPRQKLSIGISLMQDLAASTPAEAQQTETPPADLAQDQELVQDFVTESREHLDSIEQQLLTIEKDPSATDAVHAIFRSFHTIKGLAGFLNFACIQEVAHEVETALDKARRGELAISGGAVDVILESRDYIAQWLNALAAGSVSVADHPHLARPAALLARVHDLQAGKLAAGGSAQTVVPSTNEEPAPAAAVTQTKAQGNRSVKVDTEKLDYLVDMVGELVIAQSLVRHDPEMASLKNAAVLRNLAQLARITDEVQKTAMAMRMVPIGPLFQKMARLVRDLSRKSRKSVVFECEGENVELDRNIVEELADPLMHMVRNSCDHGIESAAKRKAAGKSETGKVCLRAFHRSGQIVIEVSDDGGGIQRDRVLEKARDKGLISPGSTLTDSEILNLIFQPGFSTAEKVTDVSGRGVGMDVVRKQIQRLRGSVDISSEVGTGTTFALKLPLTLAIIDGLVVSTGADRYIIPLASVQEMLRPTAGAVSKVEGRAEVVLIRERLLPVIRLHERFGITPKSTDPSECVLVVAEVEGTAFCLMVDELIGKQEVVIKSLGPVFQQVPGVAGGAILGDGQIGLILDLKGIFAGRSDA